MSAKRFLVGFDCRNTACGHQVVVSEEESLADAQKALDKLYTTRGYVLATCSRCGRTQRYYPADTAPYIQGPLERTTPVEGIKFA